MWTGDDLYAFSIHDNTHEGKSIIDLTEEKKIYSSSFRESRFRQNPVEFSAETRISGIEFIPNKKISLNKADKT